VQEVGIEYIITQKGTLDKVLYLKNVVDRFDDRNSI
jgi:hypothetical protein